MAKIGGGCARRSEKEAEGDGQCVGDLIAAGRVVE
jgi:hypothetical protein